MNRDIPLRKTMCATCPFRPGSKYVYLVPDLTASALTECSRICHSTGSNGLMGRTSKPDHICRGARDVQLQILAGVGYLPSPTDEAWNAQRVAIGMKPTVVANPA